MPVDAVLPDREPGRDSGLDHGVHGRRERSRRTDRIHGEVPGPLRVDDGQRDRKRGCIRRETVGERDPQLTAQQFRERRLARMRQWDRATGDPETTDRIVGGLIGLGAFTDASVQEIPRPPTAPADPSTASSVAKPSVTPEAVVPTTTPTVKSTKPASPADTQYDPALFEQLRSWRLAAAQQEGQKAFYVFPDATLERIAAAQPQTLEELEAVKGVGPKKLQQYGQAVLDITREEGDKGA